MSNNTFVLWPPGSSHHVSSHGWQWVSESIIASLGGSPIMSLYPITNRQWVAQCFISLPGSLINHVSSHDQQQVSDTALFLCQAVSSIMSHPMTNREWVVLLYFFVPGSLINHVSSPIEQVVSLMNFTTTSFIASHPMNKSSLWETSHFCITSLHMTNR